MGEAARTASLRRTSGGYNALQDVLIETLEQGVQYATAYVFSTENWKRSQTEVGRLMGLVLKMLTSDLHILQEMSGCV